MKDLKKKNLKFSQFEKEKVLDLHKPRENSQDSREKDRSDLSQDRHLTHSAIVIDEGESEADDPWADDEPEKAKGGGNQLRKSNSQGQLKP